MGVLGLLAVAGVAFAGDLVEEHTDVTFGGTTSDRLYYVYQPEACLDNECPMVIMFHGLNPQPDTFEAAWETANSDAGGYGPYYWKDTADENGFVMVFPSASSMAPKSFFGFQYDPPAAGGTGPSQRWDMQAVSWSAVMNPTGHTPKATKDTKFVENIIDDMVADYKVLPTHVFTTGHSHGAFFSSYVAMLLPNKIEAFASHSGGRVEVWGVSWPAYPTNANSNSSLKTEGLLIHSENDGTCSYSWSVDLASSLDSRGHYVEFDTIVPGKDHGWDTSRNQRQWDFFVNHSPELPEEEPAEEDPEEEDPEVVVVVADFLTDSGFTSEGSGPPVPVYVYLDQAPSIPVSVLVSVDAEASTAVEGVDFEMSNGLLTFGTDELGKPIYLELFPDYEDEGDETIVLRLEVVEGPVQIGNIPEYAHSFSDSTKVAHFEVADGKGIESGGSVSVNVHMDGKGLGNDVEVAIGVSGTAEEGVDYNLSTNLLSFESTAQEKTLTLDILEDMELEDVETIILTLDVVDGFATEGEPSVYTFALLDDTPGPVVAGFAMETGSAYEGELRDIYVNLDGKGDNGIALLVSVDAGESTAEEGVDFEIMGNGVLQFAPGEMQKSVEIEFAKDILEEEDETVVLKLEVLDGYVELGEKTVYTHVIKDSTSPYLVGFLTADGKGAEEAGGEFVTLRTDGKGWGLVKYNIFVDPSSTAEKGVDFDLLTTSAESEGGDVWVEFEVYGDDEVESNETIVLGFEVAEGYAVGANWLFDTYTYTIFDDDEVVPVPLCSDGMDNDDDGLVDEEDPGCEGEDDDDEYNEPEPPVDEPEDYWAPKFLTVLKQYTGIVWEHDEEDNLALLFDYGVYGSKLYDPFIYGPYSGYDIQDVEVSWKKPFYFWWGVWEKADGTTGLYRRASNQSNFLNKAVYFGDYDELASLDFKDLVLDKDGNPHVLFDNGDGEAVVAHYNQNGKLIWINYRPNPSDGFVAESITVGMYGDVRILFVGDGAFVVETTGTLGEVVGVPTGHEVVDFDNGWGKNDPDSRVMLVDSDGNASVLKVAFNGDVNDEFDFDAPDGYAFEAMETGSNSRIYLMLSGENGTEAAEVWKVNATSGNVEDVREYEMN